jgi:hypothetical protein
VISADGNMLAMKAAHGQIFENGRWVKAKNTTTENAIISAQNIMRAIQSM